MSLTLAMACSKISSSWPGEVVCLEAFVAALSRSTMQMGVTTGSEINYGCTYDRSFQPLEVATRNVQGGIRSSRVWGVRPQES